MVFDSVKEYKRFCELRLLEKAGAISDLRRQVKYILIPTQYATSTEVYTRGPRRGEFKRGQLLEREVAYFADFVYLDENGETIVEDTKGMRTTDYVLKRKLMLFNYGIQIREV